MPEVNKIIQILIFFDYVNFQIVKINGFNEIILTEAGLRMAFEFVDGGIQPDRLSKIKLITDLVYCGKDLVGAGVCCIIADHGIPQQMVISEYFSPYAEHRGSPFSQNYLQLSYHR